MRWSIAGEYVGDAEMLPVSYDTLVTGLGLSVGVHDVELKATSGAGTDYDYTTLEILSEPAPPPPSSVVWYPAWDNPRQCHGDADGNSVGIQEPGKRKWVSLDDLLILDTAWRLPPPFGGYDPACDFDRDGDIDGDDALILSIWYMVRGILADCPTRINLELMEEQFLPVSSTYVIRWTDCQSQDSCPGNYLLDYSTDNGQTWAAVDSNVISNTCYYDWLVPSADSNQCLIRITDADNSEVSNISDDLFHIYQCQETFAKDQNHDCYLNFIDFAGIAVSWLEPGGSDMNDIAELVEDWGDCGNPFDPDCGP